MADLKLDVDIGSLLQADKAVRDFERRFTDLERAARRGVTSQDRLVAVFDRLDRSGLSLSQVYRSMEKDLESNARTAARLENEFRSLNLSQKSARDSAQAMEQAFRQQEQAIREANAAVQQSQRDYQQLLAALNPTVAAQQRMRQTEDMLSAAVRNGAITKEQATQALREYSAQMTAFQAQAARSARGLNRMGVVVQQTGYQVGDFLVQVQSGTNWMVAFGQQATQLAGLLTLSMNPATVALGAALSIIIPLTTAVGAAFLRTRRDAESAAEGVETLEQSIQSLDASLRDWVRTQQAAAMGLTPDQYIGGQGLEEAEANLQSAREELERLLAVRDALARAPASPEGAIMNLLFGSQAGNVEGEIEAAVAAVEQAEQRVNQINERLAQQQQANYAATLAQYEQELALQEAIARFGVGHAEVERLERQQALQAELDKIDAQEESLEISEEQAASLREQATAIANVREQAARMQEALAGASPIVRVLVEEFGKTREEAERAASAIEALMDFNSGNVVAQINAITNALRIGTAQAIALAQALPGYTSGGVSGPDGAVAQTQALTGQGLNFRAIIPEGAESGGGRSGGGGGGGGFVSGVPAIRELQAAIEAAADEARRFEQEISLLDSAIENGVINQQQYNELVAAAESAYGRAQQGAYDYEAALESLDNTFASSLEDTFMSIIDGSKSAGEAFRDMARQMIAEAMRMLVIRPMIQSLFGGGGGKGGGLFSGLLGGLFRRESGGSMMPNQPYLVGERGPELVIPGRSATVTNANLTERTMGGGGGTVVVNQTINVSTGVQQTVRNEIKQLMPQIAESAKSAVVDAKRRGGSYGRAFS